MNKRILMNIGLLTIVSVVLMACAGAATEPTLTTEPTPATTVTAETPAPEESDPAPAATGGEYLIIPAQSEARFIIGEVLNGADFTVVGVTNEVEGSITIDTADLASVTMSPIRVDLSNLKTDSTFRDGAIKNFILETGKEEYRYAVFASQTFSGIPDSVEVGVPFDFQITGDLTIHGVTREVTFDATVTPISATRLEGIASATILYQDFDIAILRLPAQVASVEDQVILEIEFVAEKAD